MGNLLLKIAKGNLFVKANNHPLILFCKWSECLLSSLLPLPPCLFDSIRTTFRHMSYQEVVLLHRIVSSDNFNEEVKGVMRGLWVLFNNYVFGSCFMVSLV